MQNDNENTKELLFLEPLNTELSEKENIEKLAKILENLGFNIIDKEKINGL